MIDQSVVNLVKDELNSGKAPEQIIPKLRKIGYTDDDIENIFRKIRPGEITIIKRPSRPTVFKTIFSAKVLGIIALILIIIAGLYYLSILFGITETVEEKAKRVADLTSDAQLFLKSVELQNAIIGCIPEFDAEQANLALCTVIQSYKISQLGGGKYEIIYSIDENPKCPKNYIIDNNLLSVEVDLVSGFKIPVWIDDKPFNEDVVNSLYPKRNNCDALSPYIAEFINKMSSS